MGDRDEEAIRKYLETSSIPTPQTVAASDQRPCAIVAQQRCPPGNPQPADEVLAEYEERNRSEGNGSRPAVGVLGARPQDVFVGSG